MVERPNDDVSDKPVLDSNTATEEDVSEYIKTLSPEEREAYINYMILQNKEVAEQKRQRDSEIIAQMKSERRTSQASTTPESPQYAVVANQQPTMPANPTTPAVQPLPNGDVGGDASNTLVQPGQGSAGSPFEFSVEEQKTLDVIKKEKKSSHIMLYIAIGCFVFLVLLIITAKIILSPSVTIAIR